MASDESVRKDIISQINRNEGFSVFWACDNAHRAKMLDRLATDGEIVYHEEAPFPWIPAKLNLKD
jgi:hypothetical protein